MRRMPKMSDPANVDWQKTAKDLEFALRVVANERDREAARAKFLGDYLARIHGYLYPPLMTVEGRTYAFHPPNPHEYMQKLSDAIRAIPDQIVVAAANRG